jgi:hypothetical protein
MLLWGMPASGTLAIPAFAERVGQAGARPSSSADTRVKRSDTCLSP